MKENLAKILGDRWCVSAQAVQSWLKARGFTKIIDLMVFSLDHGEAMDKALNDFWEFST